MRILLLGCLMLLPLYLQGLNEQIYDYFLLGPQVMRDARYLYHSSRDVRDYDALRQQVWGRCSPWYIRLISAIFEPSEGVKLERLWYRVRKQLKRTASLEIEEQSILIAEYTEKLQPLKAEIVAIVDAPVPVGAFTNYDFYRRSKKILGRVINDLLQWYTDLLIVINQYFVQNNAELVSSVTRLSLVHGMDDMIGIKKEYDMLGVSAIDLWYITMVDKQLESYLTRVANTVMPMSGK